MTELAGVTQSAPEPQPLFGRVVGGLGVTLGFVSAVIQILLFVLWFREDTTPPTGWGLVALISLPLAALFLIVLSLLLRLGQVIRSAEREQQGLARITSTMVEQRSTDQQQVASLIESLTAQAREIQQGERTQQLAIDLSTIAHDINRRLATDFGDDFSKDDLYRMLKGACRDVVSAFERAVGAKYRCSIKYLVESHAAKVVTICRDRGRASDPVEHLVENNTDFREIWYNNTEYWICGDIGQFRGYQNTTPDHLSRYRSVITWPMIVREGWGFRETADRGRAEPIVGFLCLDSPSPNVVSESEHVRIAFPVADALAACFERRFALDQPEGKPPTAGRN